MDQFLGCGPDPFQSPTEFAIDLCRDSSPNQVVLAVLARRETLQSTLEDLQVKMNGYKPKNKSHYPGDSHSGLSIVDSLLVPNMNWRITHRFSELEGEEKLILNSNLKGNYIEPAMQTIAFKLDRSGASLSSQSEIGVKGGPCHFHFDRPFLIYLKKRGAKHPFLVMWVDNAELMIKY